MNSEAEVEMEDEGRGVKPLFWSLLQALSCQYRGFFFFLGHKCRRDVSVISRSTENVCGHHSMCFVLENEKILFSFH